MTSISKIVERQAPGVAGNWRVVPGAAFVTTEASVAYGEQAVADFARALAGSLVLCHYDWPMLGWRQAPEDELGLGDPGPAYELTFASCGWASVSDQGGIRKAAEALKINLGLVRSQREIRRLVRRSYRGEVCDTRCDGALLHDGEVLTIVGRRVILGDRVKNWPCHTPLLWRHAEPYYTPPTMTKAVA